MAKKNKKSGIRIEAGTGILYYSIYIALIAAGAAMIYFLGFPFVDSQNYYMIICGVILILLGLIFLTAGKIPDIVSTFLAAFLLIAIGILHPVTLFLAACGVYIIVDKILILTGHQDVAEHMGDKINSFFRKVFARKLEEHPDLMNQETRNKSMGIKKVNDMTHKQPPVTATQDTKAPAAAAFIDTQATTGDMSEAIATQDVIPEAPVIIEPDRAASEAMAKPDAGEFITNFVAGFIFGVGGLMMLLPGILFGIASKSIIVLLPPLLVGGILLGVGIWQIAKGILCVKKYTRKI